MNRLSRMRTAVLTVVTGLALSAAGGTVPADADTSTGPGTLVVKTVPPTQGARVAAEGGVAVTNSKGVAQLPVQNFAALDHRFHVLDTRVSDDRKVTIDRIVGAPSRSRGGLRWSWDSDPAPRALELRRPRGERCPSGECRCSR